jgi:hypothetical protein
MWKRVSCPWLNLPKPSFVRLKVTSDPPVVARHGEAVLQVQVTGEIPAWLQAPLRWLGADASVCLLAKATGRVDRLSFAVDARPMSRVQRRLFVTSLSDLQESLTFAVRCGDAETDLRRVRVELPPRILDPAVTVEAPAYTGFKPVVYTNLYDPIAAFPASRVQLRFACDQTPLKNARMVALQTGATLAELTPEPKTGTYRYRFTMEAAVEMEIVLVNEFGFEEHQRVSLALREDQPPVVRLEYPVGEVSAAPGELVPLQVEISDDLGLVKANIRYQINPSVSGNDTVYDLPLPLETNLLAQTRTADFDLEKTGVAPGDEVLFWVDAQDTGLNNANSQPIRVRVAALAGNENEHRRILALRLIAQTLSALQPTSAQAWNVNEEAYERIADAARAGEFTLEEKASLGSLLNFIEREQYFTDSLESANDLRMLRGLVSAIANPPAALRSTPDGSAEARKAALQQVTNSILPGLRIERIGRDIARRALNLRGEAANLSAAAGASEQRTQANLERRVNLLMDALDGTSEEFVKLAGMTPLVKESEIKAFSARISRAGRELKSAGEARRAAGVTLCEQIDGWIRLLLPVLPEWHAQHRTARAALQERYERLRQAIGESARRKADVEAALWLAADARMVERCPYSGLGARLACAGTGDVIMAAPPIAAACRAESALYARLAIEDEYADWLDSPRIKPPERRLAMALRALDLAADEPARAAAAARLQTLDIQSETAGDPETYAVTNGLYGNFPALTAAVGGFSETHVKGVERLAARAVQLREMLKALSGEDDTGGFTVDIPTVNAIQSGFAEWESDAIRVLCLMHLDLAYGDPRREVAMRLSLALPDLYGAVDRYRELVPPLLDQMRAGVGRGKREAAAAARAGGDLVACVTWIQGKAKQALSQLQGETTPATANKKESQSVREMRVYIAEARKLADAQDPASVAAAFFAAQPAAASMVLARQLTGLADMQERMRKAAAALTSQAPESAAFRDPMREAAQSAGSLERALRRFPMLDPGGAAQAVAGEIRKRLETLVASDKESRERIRYAMDELQRKAQEFENLLQDLISRNQPATPSGWRGGPQGIRNGAARRDAECARHRVIAQFERARRAAAFGFDAILAAQEKGAGTLPDQPLAGTLFAWRSMHSSLGGNVTGIIDTNTNKPPEDPLLVFLQQELDKGRKIVPTLTKHGFPEQTVSYFESVSGWLRFGTGPSRPVKKP